MLTTLNAAGEDLQRLARTVLVVAGAILFAGAAYGLVAGAYALTGTLAFLSLVAVIFGVFGPLMRGKQKVGLTGAELNFGDLPSAPVIGDESTIFMAKEVEGPSYDQALLSLLTATGQVDFAVVDLGRSRGWLSSRLFILAALLERSRGASSIVFIGDRDGVARSYIGIADIRAVRWSLGRQEPQLDAALTAAEAQLFMPLWPTWFQPMPAGPVKRTPTDVTPSNRSDPISYQIAGVLYSFLQRLRIDPAPPDDLPSGWVSLEHSYGDPHLHYWECATWIDGTGLRKLLGDALEATAVRESRSGSVSADDVIRWKGNVVPVVNQDGVFVRGADRVATAAKIAPTPLVTAHPQRTGRPKA